MKNRILEIFREQPNIFISGEQLSEELGISRNAVWKAITALKSMGYEFHAKTKKGYMLIRIPDIPYMSEIKPFLMPELSDIGIMYFDEIDSTSDYAKKAAIDDPDSKTVVIAKRQSGGRGKLGSKWESDGGLYMSAVLRPKVSITTAMQLIDNVIMRVAGIINEVFLIETVVKNHDIFLDDSKVCGVLIEFAGEVDRLEYMTVGIGIRLRELECKGHKTDSVVGLTADIINGLYGEEIFIL